MVVASTMRKQSDACLRESGATLVAVLVVVTALALLSLIATRSVSTELAMLRATVYRQGAFEAAASGIAIALSQSSFDFGQATKVTALFGPDEIYSVEATTRYRGSTPILDAAYSLGIDAPIVAHHFEVESIGRAPQNGISIQRQGFYIVGPPR